MDESLKLFWNKSQILYHFFYNSVCISEITYFVDIRGILLLYLRINNSLTLSNFYCLHFSNYYMCAIIFYSLNRNWNKVVTLWLAKLSQFSYNLELLFSTLFFLKFFVVEETRCYTVSHSWFCWLHFCGIIWYHISYKCCFCLFVEPWTVFTIG